MTFVTALVEDGLMSANDNRGKLAEAWAESIVQFSATV